MKMRKTYIFFYLFIGSCSIFGMGARLKSALEPLSKHFGSMIDKYYSAWVKKDSLATLKKDRFDAITKGLSDIKNQHDEFIKAESKEHSNAEYCMEREKQKESDRTMRSITSPYVPHRYIEEQTEEELARFANAKIRFEAAEKALAEKTKKSPYRLVSELIKSGELEISKENPNTLILNTSEESKILEKLQKNKDIESISKAIKFDDEINQRKKLYSELTPKILKAGIVGGLLSSALGSGTLWLTRSRRKTKNY